MKICRRCEAEKKSDLGPFCKSCAQYFNVIKRGQHAFKDVKRPAVGHGRTRRNVFITLPTVSICGGAL
jgi:hypothetical protein